MPWFLVHYDKILFKFWLLKSMVFINVSHQLLSFFNQEMWVFCIKGNKFFIFYHRMCFWGVGEWIILSFSSFLLIILISWKLDHSSGSIFYFFSNMRGQSLTNQCFGVFIMKFNVNNKRCLMLSLCEILSRTLLNSSSLGGCSNTAMWQWIRHLLKFFLPVFLSMLKWNSTFSFLLSSSKISASKASCVFLQLKLPSNIFSNILACSASVGSAI